MFSSRLRRRARARRAPRRPRAWSRDARHCATASRCWASTRRVDDEDAAVGARRAAATARSSVLVEADDDLLAGLDAADALAVRVDERGLHVVDRLDRAAVLGDDRHLGARALEQLRDEPLHDLRALEDVGVLEQVGLVGEHLLDAQRPLLVPRARQAERLVPRRQLDRAGAGVAPERDRERLEHDALHVVLRLGLGQAERVDLHAVAEAQVLGRPRRRSARGRAPPTASPIARSFACSSTNRTPALTKNEMRPKTLPMSLLADALAHRVEHGHRVGERVGDLLDRRRARLLQVVAADVDRVPLAGRARPCRRPCRRSAASTARAGTRRSRGRGTP